MIQTPRLNIIHADATLWEAVLLGNKPLSMALGVNVPKRWTENADAFPVFVKMLKDDPTLEFWGGKLIVHRADNLLIGTCGFKGKPSDEGRVEIGYEIKDTYRGQGLATEVAGALIDFAQQNATLTAIDAHTIAPENASTAVLKKLKFEFIGPVPDPKEGTIYHWQRRL
jgi:[ribosomal protein S5]-alanine N-acetyltransferase